MNEKFKLLAEKSGFMMWSDEPWKPEGAIVDWAAQYDDELKIFAELIVKETLQVARAGIEFGDGMEDAVYKYFGVEE